MKSFLEKLPAGEREAFWRLMSQESLRDLNDTVFRYASAASDEGFRVGLGDGRDDPKRRAAHEAELQATEDLTRWLMDMSRTVQAVRRAAGLPEEEPYYMPVKEDPDGEPYYMPGKEDPDGDA